MTITLATLSKATAQEVFDQVATHLLTQNEVSSLTERNDEGFCAYRGDNGLKCAAGCLIGEKEYSLGMEGRNWAGLIELGLVPDVHANLIQDLQTVHDIVRGEQWREVLQEVAEDHDLTFKEPT